MPLDILTLVFYSSLYALNEHYLMPIWTIYAEGLIWIDLVRKIWYT